tara:strand:- start:574 stop:768 length:195 start_codon:yes stop_codon:yes gene_type:complete
MAISLTSTREDGLKFNNCSTSSGDNTSGRLLGVFGAEIKSNGDVFTNPFFFKYLKNPFADDRCL